MIDTHTHLYLPDFSEDFVPMMLRGENAGVRYYILPNIDAESLPMMKDFHSRFPDNTFMTIGLHPTEVKEDWEKHMNFMEKEIGKDKYVGIGEIGIDLYWDKSQIENQKKAFEYQLLLAQKLELPVIIHSREALEEILEVIGKVKPTVPLIFHSFTGNLNDVKRIREVCDPWFGINGVITYKNAAPLREAIPEIGLEKILLETDSPYLTPVPHRGKRNESSYLGYIRDKIAQTLQVSPQIIEKQTTLNASHIFKI
ncbi:MAG: TatD family hydrolase [Muribaculaceae bacterium]|nr:TatD family hydrolase [Muribaculaceae bacterium]